MQLRPVNYQWKDDKLRNDIGFIAQKIQQILPELVIQSKEHEYFILNYQVLIPVLVQAVQELKIENTKLNSMLIQKESDIVSLQTELNNYISKNSEKI